MTLGEIERLTRDYSQAREALAERVRELEDEIEKTRRSQMPAIKRALEKATEKHTELYHAIESAPELFRQPRTLMIANIKIGFQKGKGEIRWDDDARVVELIRKHRADEFDLLVKVSERPVKSALAQLAAADLRRLGVTVVEAGDQVVIRAADSEIDKLVSALLKEAQTEPAEEPVEA
jgi:Bacteriophage Mu Gam like protein